jgi:hypothetical protein
VERVQREPTAAERRKKAVASDSTKTTESGTSYAEWREWARWYVDQIDPLVPADGVTARITSILEDRFPAAGLRDAMDQIGRHVQSIASDLSSLENRMRYRHGW